MAPPAQTPAILAFGDSLTAGYGLPAAQSFPSQLELRLRTLHPQAVVRNAGRSGDTTADALRRLPAVLAALPFRPDLVIVELGANDLLRGMPPARTRDNLDAILTHLSAAVMPTMLAGFTVPVFLPDLAAAYHGLYEGLAARHGAFLHPFFPPGIMGNPDFVLADGLHPNAAAIVRVADAFLPAVLVALNAKN